MRTVTLCGSIRHEDAFKAANLHLSRLGLTILTLSAFPSDGDNVQGYGPDIKEMVDLVYLNKISMSDAILVLDVPLDAPVGGHPDFKPYIGFSTAREIIWACLQGKTVVRFSDCFSWDDAAGRLCNYTDDEKRFRIMKDAMLQLERAIGRETVGEMVDQSMMRILHAGLTKIMLSGRDGQDGNNERIQALETLNSAGLVALEPEQADQILKAGMPLHDEPVASTYQPFVDDEPSSFVSLPEVRFHEITDEMRRHIEAGTQAHGDEFYAPILTLVEELDPLAERPDLQRDTVVAAPVGIDKEG